MAIDWNTHINTLLSTMPVWLPIVLAAFGVGVHLKQPGYMDKGN